jgi:hypothetical protein
MMQDESVSYVQQIRSENGILFSQQNRNDAYLLRDNMVVNPKELVDRTSQFAVLIFFNQPGRWPLAFMV